MKDIDQRILMKDIISTSANKLKSIDKGVKPIEKKLFLSNRIVFYCNRDSS